MRHQKQEKEDRWSVILAGGEGEQTPTLVEQTWPSRLQKRYLWDLGARISSRYQSRGVGQCRGTHATYPSQDPERIGR